MFKNGQFVRKGNVSSSSVSSYSGSYNSGYTGSYNSGTIGTNNNSSQSSGTKHGYRTEYYYDTCDFCHGSGRCSSCVGTGYVTNLGGSNYNCPNCKIPGNKYKLGNGACANCQNGKVKKHRYVEY